MLTALVTRLARLRKRAEHSLQTADRAAARAGAEGRVREVWTGDEWAAIRRGLDTLRRRGIEVYLRCDAPTCQRFVMTHHRTPEGLVLRCPHKDRLLSRHI